MGNFANYPAELWNTQPIEGSHFCHSFKIKFQYIQIQYVYFYLSI